MPPKQAPTNLTDIPSPTTSIGPTTVRSIDHEVLQATRKGTSTKTLTKPRGFSNPAEECYRNAVIVMLLNSDRFMSFVQNWHATCITRQRDSGSSKSKGKKSTINDKYTDLLLQLQDLWAVYWKDPEEDAAGDAMDEFWTYATTLEGLTGSAVQWDVRTRRSSHYGQQDASEFFLWLLTMHKARLENIRVLPSNEVDSLDSVIQTGFRARRRCKRCLKVKAINQKRRFAPVYEDFWRVDTQQYDTTVTGPRESVKLDELLEYQMKSVDATSYCEDCQKEFETSKEGKSPEERAAANDDKVAGEDKVWSNLAFLLEVVFMHLARFGESSSNNKKVYHKDDTKVDVPEELDLTSLLDKYVSKDERKFARYRLAGVILHAGTLGRGHYINYVRTVDGKWWRIDNEEVKESEFENVNKEEQWGYSKSKTQSPPFKASMLAWERIVEKPTKAQPVPSKALTKATKPEALKATTAAAPPKGKGATSPEEPAAQPDGFIRGRITLGGQRYYIPEIPVTLPATFHRQANTKSGLALPPIILRLEIADPKDPNKVLSYDLCDANADEKVLRKHEVTKEGFKPLADFGYYAGKQSQTGEPGNASKEESTVTPGAKQGSTKEPTKKAPKAPPGGKQQVTKVKPKQDPVSGTPSPTQDKLSKMAAVQESTRTSPRLQEKALNAKQAQAEKDTLAASKAPKQPPSPSPESKAPEPPRGRGKQSKRLLGDDPTMVFEDDPDHPLRSPEVQKKPKPAPKKSSTESKASRKPSATDQPEAAKKLSGRPNKKLPTTKKATEKRSEPEQPQAPSKTAPKPTKKAAQKDNLSTSSDDLDDYIAKEEREKAGKRKRAQQEKEQEDAFITDDEAPAKKKSKGKGLGRKKR